LNADAAALERSHVSEACPRQKAGAGEQEAALVIVLLCCSAIADVAVPPFPAPETVVGLPMSSLERQLGRPNQIAAEKFSQWQADRLVLVWLIEATQPGVGSGVPSTVSRQLWFGVRGAAFPLVQRFARYPPPTTPTANR
jgi:hypothetical protein